MSQIITVGFDYKQMSGYALEELTPIMKKFGVFLHEDPRSENTDQTNFAISDHELTEEELETIFEDY